MSTMDRTFDRSSLGTFLRTRRAALQPEDVGLRRGQRRRAPGLRREEVAELCTMSADYFARLERGDGPQPSEQMLAAIARGLRLTRTNAITCSCSAGTELPTVTYDFTM
jgi:transcriptional regulator with XRE-family HTH domain